MPTVQQELQDKENIVSYARAIHRAVKTIVQKSVEEGYDSLINPSRGANPIAYAIADTVRHLAQTDEKARTLAEKLYFGTREERNHTFPIIPIPLTADIRITEKELLSHRLTYDDVIDGMRVYGAKIIETLSRSPEERKRDRNFRLLSWIFSMEGRHHTSRFYEELPPIKKPIFIDTAISGRACSTILQALDVNSLPVYPIIFVDEYGARLNPIHRRYLDNRQSLGKLKQIPMRRIVTEDKGAALLGVYAAFYPQILFAAREMGMPYASAVTWHSINNDTQHPSFQPYRETFRSFIDLITSVTRMICSAEREWGEDFEGLKDQDVLGILPHEELDKGIEKVVGNIKKYGVPKVEDPSTIKAALPKVPIEKAFETHSHVVHLWLPKSYLDEKLEKLRSVLFR